MKTGFPIVEILEDRIAPAGIVYETPGSGGGGSIFDGHMDPTDTYRFTDVDHDQVTIKFSKKILNGWTSTLAAHFSEDPDESGYLESFDLRLPDLTPEKLRGLNITISVQKHADGDGLVHIGGLYAGGIDLGDVKVQGSLGYIVAGDDNVRTSGLQSLSVESLGLPGSSAPNSPESMTSVIKGSVGKLKIAHDFDEATLYVVGGAAAQLRSVVIGGSIIGGESDSSGLISAEGRITKITVGGDIKGGAGESSGAVWSGESITRATIKGDIIGGAGKWSGALISTGNINSVTVEGSIKGGTGDAGYSGLVQADGKLISIVVLTDIVGGHGERAGMIHGHEGISKVEIKGDVIGGDGYAAGRVETSEKISAIKIGGDIIGGSANFAGSVMSVETINTISVKGDLKGGDHEGTGSIFSEKGINRVSVEGQLQGGAGLNSGSVFASGKIRVAEVKEGLLGSDGENSGSVLSFGGVFARKTSRGPVVEGDGAKSGMFYEVDTRYLTPTNSSPTYFGAEYSDGTNPWGSNGYQAVGPASGGSEQTLIVEGPAQISGILVWNLVGQEPS